MGIMLQRTLPAGFIAPCLPTKAHTLPSGGLWLHEIARRLPHHRPQGRRAGEAIQPARQRPHPPLPADRRCALPDALALKLEATPARTHGQAAVCFAIILLSDCF